MTIQDSMQTVKDTINGKHRPAQGTRCVYFPLAAITIAFALSVLALCSCEFVIFDDPNCDANPCTRTSGIYCYDASLRERVQNFFLGTIQKFVQVIGTGTAVLGFMATILLWKALKAPHGKCMFKVLGACVILCVPGQFITLSMLQSDFCWDWSKRRNFCSLGWGGNVSIAAGCLWFVSCVALCKVPQPIEREDEKEEDGEMMEEAKASGADGEVVPNNDVDKKDEENPSAPPPTTTAE